MAIAIIPLLTTAIIWLGRIGLAAFAVNEVKKLTTPQKASIDEGTKQAQAAGISDEEYKKLVAATTYDTVEQDGGEPDDFWADLSPKQKEALQFSPQGLRADMGRTKFLGISAALLMVGALAAGGVAGLRGIPILLSTLSKLAVARKAGATATMLLTIIEEGKIAGIAAVWVPGLVAGIASAGGWLTSTMFNNLNDASLWGRIFLGQAAADFEDARKQLTKTSITKPAGTVAQPATKTIIRMVQEKKPEQFIGTLFSAKLGKLEDFNRKVDDEITSEADLLTDVKINLNAWLASLPGRLGYSVVIRKDPVDSAGVKQSGTWATLTTFFTRLSGPIQPIDTILLGPVSPVTRLKLSKVIKTVEAQIPGILTGQQVVEIEIPGGSTDIFDLEGARVDLSTPRVEAKPPVIAPPTSPVDKTTSAPDLNIPIPSVPATPTLTPSSPISVAPPPSTGVQTTTPPTLTPETDPEPIPPTTPIASQILVPGVQAVVSNLNRGTNFRRAPSLSGAIISELPDGTKLRFDNDGPTADGFLWASVRVGNQDGWLVKSKIKRL